MDYTYQAPLSMGILQEKILEWVAKSSSRRYSQPKDQTKVPHIAGRFFTDQATREVLKRVDICIYFLKTHKKERKAKKWHFDIV